MTIELPYQPFPRQAKFHASVAPYRLLGGAAGAGKSEAILWEGIAKCLLKPGITGVLFRRTYPELEMSLIRKFLERCPNVLYKYDLSKHVATFKNGSLLQFAYCDSDRDVYRYQSAEFDFIGVDELTHFTEYMFTYLLSRLRTTKTGVRPSFFAATNPGNVGHGFVKARWVTKDCKEPGYQPGEYEFIPATIRDNPALMAADPAYLQRLEQLPEQERKALLHGSWDIFAGMYFSEWDRVKHVVEPFAIPESWMRIRAYDHGRNHPAVCLWGAIDWDGNLWIYREFSKRELNVDQIAAEINRLSAGERYDYSVADPAIFANTGFVDSHGGQTIAESFARYGIMYLPASNRRPDGWALFHQYLNTDKGEPRLRFFSTCTESISRIPALVHDDVRMEDVSKQNDDEADACRYMLMSLHERKSPRPLTEVEKKLAEMKRGSSIAPANFGKFYQGSL